MKSDEQKQHHGATDAQGQTKNINAGIKFLLVEIAPGNFEIVFNHRIGFMSGIRFGV